MSSKEKPLHPEDIPGWEGTIGPGPKQYHKPHVFARSVHSGAGNCVCGLEPENAIHVPVPSAPTGGYSGSISIGARTHRMSTSETDEGGEGS